MKEFATYLIDDYNKNRVALSQVDCATKLVLTKIEFKGNDFGEYLQILLMNETVE